MSALFGAMDVYSSRFSSVRGPTLFHLTLGCFFVVRFRDRAALEIFSSRRSLQRRRSTGRSGSANLASSGFVHTGHFAIATEMSLCRTQSMRLDTLWSMCGDTRTALCVHAHLYALLVHATLYAARDSIRSSRIYFASLPVVRAMRVGPRQELACYLHRL